jgi:hypothetical protein
MVSEVNELDREKIIQGDLSLENFFISKYGNYKIGDLSVLVMEGTFEM